MKIKNIEIEKVIPYENNPRINQDAVNVVKDSLSKFGFKQPIVIDKNNEIIVGHTRYYAARELNIELVPCLIANDLSEAEIKAYRIMDNKSSEYARWNFGLLTQEMQEIEEISNLDLKYTGFSDREIENMIGNIEVNLEDEENVSRMDELNQIECPSCGHRFSEFTSSK